jgi:pyridinium-3,5-bisthiocarboxylic acid mononucleotide nickel chelatase
VPGTLSEDSVAGHEGLGADAVACLECNIDDMTGEELGYALQLLLDAGALDVWFTPIVMKKNRPAVTLSVLCRPSDVARFDTLLLRETTTLGVRRRWLERTVAERKTVQVSTPLGTVTCKLKLLEGEVVSAKPEYDECVAMAQANGMSLHSVMEIVRRACQDWLAIQIAAQEDAES